MSERVCVCLGFLLSALYLTPNQSFSTQRSTFFLQPGDFGKSVKVPSWICGLILFHSSSQKVFSNLTFRFQTLDASWYNTANELAHSGISSSLFEGNPFTPMYVSPPDALL